MSVINSSQSAFVFKSYSANKHSCLEKTRKKNTNVKQKDNFVSNMGVYCTPIYPLIYDILQFNDLSLLVDNILLGPSLCTDQVYINTQGNNILCHYVPILSQMPSKGTDKIYFNTQGNTILCHYVHIYNKCHQMIKLDATTTIAALSHILVCLLELF